MAAFCHSQLQPHPPLPESPCITHATLKAESVQVRAATTPPKGSGKSSKKGTIAIGKSKGKQSKSGGKGLFGFGK